MNKKIFIQVLFCLCTTTVFSQSASIKGRVVNQKGVPITGASISVDETLGTFSDQFGRFTINNLQSKSYILNTTHLGYITATDTVMASNDSTIIIRLSEGPLQLADVVIEGAATQQLNTLSQVDIQLRPINTSQDILRMVPGLFIAQHAGGGKAEQIFLRGFDIDHGTDINLEIDGLPVNMVSHAHGQGYSDLHFLIPEIVEQVDFNKGPYYADKGNFTTAGYAAFNTQNILKNNFVKVEGGSFGTFRNVNAFQLMNDTSSREQSAYVATEYYRTDGYFDSNQHFNRLNVMAKYTTRMNDNTMFVAGLSTFNSRWDASGQIPERAVRSGMITRFGAIDDTEGGETSRTNAWVRFNHTLNNTSVVENQFYYTKYDFYLVSNFTFHLQTPEVGDQITQRESRNIYGYNGKYTNTLFLNRNTLQTQVGGGFRYDDVNDVNLYKTLLRHVFISHLAKGDVDETNLYAYVNETMTFANKLVLNASVRFDHFTFNYINALNIFYNRLSISKSIVSPKLQLNYNLNKNTDLYIKAGTGFHSNDTRVVVAQSGEDILPKAYGADLGATFRVGDALVVNTALWMLNLDQEFVYVGDEGIVEPSGKTSRKGIDLSARYQLNNWLYFDTDVNVTEPRAKEEPEGQDYIPLAPTFTSIGGLSFRLNNGLNGSVRYRYLDDHAANEDNSVVAEGYLLLDAVLKYTKPRFELSVVAENLLDREWNEAQFYTTSRMAFETDPVSEIHFTPGTPFFIKAGISFFF